ncbi:type II secretion system F family protein [Pseudovibrio ascidiaceicola]|uniref:type II secretion system F family protein n=1 Tax=Pseudovibrio ascidiaceicola TaxID=285279 RepID=UPI003D36CE7E
MQFKNYIKFPKSKRVRTYKKLMRLLNNNIMLTEALKLIENNASKDGKKSKDGTAIAVGRWRELNGDGQPIAEAMKAWIPAREYIMISGGTLSGKLGDALKETLLITDSVSTLQRKIVGGLAYPAMLLTMIIGMMLMFAIKVYPEMAQFVPLEQWPAASANYAKISLFMLDNIQYIVAGLFGLTVAIFYSLSRWTGPVRNVLDKFPPYSFYRIMMGASFLLTLSSMLKSGLTLPTALDHLKKHAQPWYDERLSAALFYLSDGKNLGLALDRSGHQFPDKETITDLRSYADLSAFDEILKTLGSEWITETVEKVEDVIGLVRIMSIFVTFLFIVWFLWAIYSLQSIMGV